MIQLPAQRSFGTAAPGAHDAGAAKQSRRDRGAAAVEFALVMPLLLILVLGIAEFGRAYNIQTTLSAAAREGVRVMALQNSSSAARTSTKSAAAPAVILTRWADHRLARLPHGWHEPLGHGHGHRHLPDDLHHQLLRDAPST